MTSDLNPKQLHFIYEKPRFGFCRFDEGLAVSIFGWVPVFSWKSESRWFFYPGTNGFGSAQAGRLHASFPGRTVDTSGIPVGSRRPGG